MKTNIIKIRRKHIDKPDLNQLLCIHLTEDEIINITKPYAPKSICNMKDANGRRFSMIYPRTYPKDTYITLRGFINSTIKYIDAYRNFVNVRRSVNTDSSLVRVSQTKYIQTCTEGVIYSYPEHVITNYCIISFIISFNIDRKQYEWLYKISQIEEDGSPNYYYIWVPHHLLEQQTKFKTNKKASKKQSKIPRISIRRSCK